MYVTLSSVLVFNFYNSYKKNADQASSWRYLADMFRPLICKVDNIISVTLMKGREKHCNLNR